MKKIEAAAKALGYELYRIGSKGHPIYRHTVTGKKVTLPGTPSDYRSLQNSLSLLRANAK
jgi:predicted RNA binding protein YcfA (HicA-like mRNA interferase family)